MSPRSSRFTLPRVAIIFLLLLGLFLCRDAWLPTARDYTAEYESRSAAAGAGAEIVTAGAETGTAGAEIGTAGAETGTAGAETGTAGAEIATAGAKTVTAGAETPQPPGAPLLAIDPRPAPAPPASAEPSSGPASGAECQHLPGADKVMVMLKTGATELYQKLPTHFVTTFKCIPNFMLFSDLNQTFAGVPVHDAIAPINQKVRQEHADFTLYRKIEKWQHEGQDLSKLKGDTGWSLDKWKFLPMLHQVFESASDDIQWFFMIEADTSVSWLNFMLWLQTMDPHKPYYLGAQNLLGDTTFAHGGSGIVISRKAAELMEAARNNTGKETYDQQWEEETAKTCCGDAVVALAFQAIEIPLTPAWPLIQGETIATVDFTDRHWCTPPLTWHHVNPIEIDTYWRFQLEWAAEHGWQTPYLYRDIFDRFLAQHVSVNRKSWNNLSKDKKFVAADLAGPDDLAFDELEDYQQAAVESEDACAAACIREGDGECIQWMWTPGRCHLGRDIRLGSSDERESEHWNCGWIQHRIEQFKERMKGCEIRWQG